MYTRELDELLIEVEKLQYKKELSCKTRPDYFEPGMMEYLDHYLGIYDKENGKIRIRFDVRGTRYEGRIELIEDIAENDAVKILRDTENVYNKNNFAVVSDTGKSLGNMPAELCNVIAPMYDSDNLEITDAKVSFVEPISIRSRHAKQPILFVEVGMQCPCVLG